MKYICTLAVLVALLAIPPVDSVQAGFNDDPDTESGWSKADDLSGGCDNAGNCSSNSSPGPASLYEYTPDRDRRSRGGTTGNLSEHGGHRTAVKRQMCRYYGVNIGWSAGTWHHAGHWTKKTIGFRERWHGPTRPHWGFSHSDTCRPLYTPTPILPPPPTYTPIPEYTPTTVPTNIAETLINIDVNVRVQGTPPSGGDTDGNGGGDYPVGGVVTASADYPSSWDRHPTWGGIRYSGCNATGSRWQARFYAPGNDCTITFTITFQDAIPTGTPAPTPTMPPQPCIPHVRTGLPLWQPVGIGQTAPGILLATQPTLTFSMTTLAGSKSIDEVDGSDRWNKAEVKVERWDPARGTRGDWREAARMTWEVVGTNFRADQRKVSGGALPVPRGYNTEGHKEAATTIWALNALEGGEYRISSKTSNQNCVWHQQFWSFRIDGTPPPPPGPSQATLYAWVYSPDDDEFLNTRDNPNPARWRWLYGGPMEFYPDIDMDFTLDPALAAQGYHVEHTITGWTFLGSPTLGPTEEELDYEETVQTLWTTIDGLQDDPDVYEYLMPYVKPQPLDVAVHYEYQLVDASGTAVGEPVEDTLTGTFTIGIVTPVMR